MNSYFALLILIIIGLLLGICTFHTTIPLLYHFKFGQSIRKEGPKRHNLKSGTPTLVGIVIFLVSFFLWITLLLFNHYINSQTIFNILQLLIPFLGFGLIGFIDDFLIIIKKNNVGLHPKTKLLLQILIAIISTLLYQLMNRNNVLNFFGESLYLSFFYLIWIVIGFVGFSNATNLTDGIDGLLGGCSTISFTGIYLIAIYEENYVVAYLSISIIIALLAFLFFNLPKAKIFMGDCGALYIGFMISVISLLGFGYNASAFFTLGAPIIVLMVPIMDTLIAILRRKIHHKKFSEADRGHLHHNLMFKLKLGQRKSVLVLYLVTFLFSLSSYLYYYNLL